MTKNNESTETTLEGIKVVLKKIDTFPSMLAEIHAVVDTKKYGNLSMVIGTVLKSDKLEQNPDGFWLPCTSTASKAGKRFSQVSLNGVRMNQLTDEIKADIINMVKEKFENKSKVAEANHAWCR